MTPAEYAVLWHVRDTVVQPRAALADWTARHLPNSVPSSITADDCLRAIDALVQRGLLIELTASDIAADLARWRAEPLPVSWGVDRDRHPGDVDLTEAGFRSMLTPNRSPRVGYVDAPPDLIRVLGETEESCERHASHIVARIDQPPWRWRPEAVRVEPVQPLGPWWHSRFECIPTGFEIAVRRPRMLAR